MPVFFTSSNHPFPCQWSLREDASGKQQRLTPSCSLPAQDPEEGCPVHPRSGLPCTGCSRGRAGPSVLRWCLVPSLLQPEEPAAGPWALSPWLPAHPRHIPHQEQEGSQLCRAAGGRMLWGKPPPKTCSQWQAGTGSCARSWRAFGPIRTTNTERGVAAANEEIEERQKKNSLN